ncbi:methyl-accepting chemotaxis protein [Shewanella sp. A25]|nr:methyl-accepting chemotaxis protein [Shewanella shenzhenensis]
MKKMLENLPIATKLRLSFGFMLALSLLITCTGWTKLDDMIVQSDKLSTIQNLNKIIFDARYTRENYVRTHDDSYRLKLNSLIEQLTEILVSSQEKYTQPENVENLKKAISYMGEYKNIFQRIVPLVQAEGQASSSAIEQNAQFLKQHEQHVLNLRKTAFESSDWQLIANLNDISLESSNIQQQLSNIVSTGTLSEESFHTLQNQLSQMQHSNILQPAAQATIANIEGQLQQYMKAHRSLIAVTQEYAATAANLRATIDNLEKGLLKEQQEMSDQARLVLMLVSGTVLLIGLAAPFIITGAIATPLRETVLAAERIANGDLTNAMHTTREDEVGALQNAIGSMTLSLRELIDNVSCGIAEISAGASQLSAVSEQNRVAMAQQRIETEQVATAMNEMAATVHDVACNAEQTSEATGGAEQLTHEGYSSMKLAINAIQGLNTDIEHTSEAMQLLAQQTHGISRVMDVIKSVAEQTNLLALNAAIEAARAGESGRGFAVVADEVRSLAKRTQESTDEIESMIKQLQDGASTSLQMMENSRVVASNNVKNAADVGELFEQIAKAVSSVQLMNHQIAAASEQQSTVAEEINRSIAQVNEISNQTAVSSEETAAATEKLVALGAQLQHAIERFRIS